MGSVICKNMTMQNGKRLDRQEILRYTKSV